MSSSPHGGQSNKKREVSEETSRSIDCAFARSGRAPQGRSFGKNRAERHAHAAHAHLHSVHEHVRSHGDLPKKPKSASCFVRGNIRSDRLIFSHYSIPHFPLSRKIPPETEIFLLDFALFSESRTFLSKANFLSLRHVVTPPLTSSFRTIFSQKNGSRICGKIKRRDNRVRAERCSAISRLPLCPYGTKFPSFPARHSAPSKGKNPITSDGIFADLFLSPPSLRDTSPLSKRGGVKGRTASPYHKGRHGVGATPHPPTNGFFVQREAAAAPPILWLPCAKGAVSVAD